MDPSDDSEEAAAAQACVVAAIKQLTATMARHSQAQMAVANATQAQLDTIGEMGVELRSCVKIVQVFLDAFVRRKELATQGVDDRVPENPEYAARRGSVTVQSTDPSQNVQVVDLSGGPGSENTCVNGGNARDGPKFPPGLISQLLEETIIMGPVVEMQDCSGAAAGLHNTDPVTVPPSVRGKLQARFGELRECLGSASGERTRAGNKGKMLEQSPEETKRSEKMRRSARETALHPYGYKKYIICKFKILEKHKYTLQEAQMIAYLFTNTRNQAEVLFKRGSRKMDREDFATLCPGNEPSDYVMEIYVQMKEVLHPSKENHLYLVVVDIPKTKIWIFNSFPSNDSGKTRIYAARGVATALDYIIRVGFHELDVLGDRPPLSK
ncbi:hypothetical protein PIB30_015581 [Stylosanthes scabra]|uniref:Uncharacterized protein n=1 Tax=Stylosanthes scabra TaxID=79078 RepID=A0ABU6Q7V2_9FABA|nr:hypothetical protein [Stylosanthes scabra]